MLHSRIQHYMQMQYVQVLIESRDRVPSSVTLNGFTISRLTLCHLEFLRADHV